jgi:glyoxylase-like metal-dependent hydrolase (beta-lactamase superfamily II)/rhodanese-related sulfurtransferase
MPSIMNGSSHRIFRQLFDARSSTFTYLLADKATREAVLIDSVFEQFARDSALIKELGLRLLYTLETHVHADHVTAAWLFKEHCGSKIVVAAAGGAEGVDVAVAEGDVIRFGSETLAVLATPGHTNGCVTYVTSERDLAFSGDALLIRAAGRTDFQQGDAAVLYRSVHEKIFTLPPECLVYPAHDYQGREVTTVDEEQRLNPRLGGERSLGDFVGYMTNLGLPHPKQIDVAVPANLRAGRPDANAAAPAAPSAPTWAPVVRTFAGIPQIEPEWVAEHRAESLVLDVREPSEWNGELGHIRGAKLVPLGELRAKLGELPKDTPIVAVCRSGGRSAQACVILEGAGFSRVANLSGGMIGWRSLGFAVDTV